MSLGPGTRLGIYELEAPLGKGGMGEVYRAVDTALGRGVAIKILPTELADSPVRLSRFEREAQLLASLNHPNIATLYGFFRDPIGPVPAASAAEELPAAESGSGDTERSGRAEAVPYLVMELVEGEDLAARISRSALSVEEAVATFVQVANGLEAAHECGVVHRDLKPANLMTSTDGRVKILDFGIAKGSIEASIDDKTPLKTATGLAIGTPGYMSPEQARGGAVDKRSDIWSFGCVLFEALSGRSPFPGATPADRTAAMLTGGPDLAALPGDLPLPMRQLVQRCLVADPRQRLRDIGEARVQLEALGRQHLDGDTVSTGWRAVDPDWRPTPEGSIPGRPNWVLDERLGTGGFGEAWLARHAKTGAKRVLKLCLDPERVDELRREVTLLRILRQALGERADIAQLLDWQLDAQPAFLEMEYAEGGDLERYCEQRGGIDRVPFEDRLEIVAKAAVALAAAHSVGVLHQDLKPSNILVGDDAETGRPKARLTDFGVGSLLDRDLLASPGITVAKLTQTLLSSGSSGGTPLYAAPEVLAGKPPTIQSDVYSLGVVLFQVVVGDLARPLAPGWERAVVDDLLRADIAACVDGSPERRLSSASELADRLRGLDARRIAIEEEERRSRQELEERRRVERETARFERRRRQFVLVSLVGVALTVAVAIVAWRERLAAAEERSLREELRRSLYLSDMNLAGRAFSQGSRGQATRLLEKHLPGPGHADLRRWEWYHLWHATHLYDVTTVVGGGPSSPPAVSPRGDAVATIDFFGVVHLHDAELQLRNLGKSEPPAGGELAVSPDGEILASLSRGGVTIWDVDAALAREPVRLMRPLRALSSEAGRGLLGFSPHERLLAAGYRSGRLNVWDTSSWDLVASALAPGPVIGLTFGADPGRLTVAIRPSERTEPATLIVYEVEGMRAIRSAGVDDVTEGASLLAAAPANGLLATAERGGVGLWSPGLERQAILPTARPVDAVAISADGSRVAAGLTTTAEVVVWTLAPEVALLTVLRGHEQRVSGLAFSADGRTLYSAGQDSRLTRWDLADAVRFDRLPGVHLWGKLAYSEEGRFLSYGGGEWPDRLAAERWDVETRSVVETPSAARGFVNYAVSEQGGAVVGMAADGEIRRGDLSSGSWRSVARLTPEDAAGVGPMAVSSDGRRVAWDLKEKTDERRAAVLDTATGSIAFLPGDVRIDVGAQGPDAWPRDAHPTFSPDGTQLVVGRFNGSTVWDLESDPPSLRYVTRGWGTESCHSYSPDGTMLAICSQDNAIRVLDARTGESRTRLEGHAGFATSASFSADGRTLVSVGSDSTIRIWDVEAGQARTLFDALERPAWRVAMSPAGDSLATVVGAAEEGPGAEGELWVWRVASDPLSREDLAGEEERTGFAGATFLRCAVSGVDTAPLGSSFNLFLRLGQTDESVEGEVQWPWGLGEVEGIVERGSLVLVDRTEGECPIRSEARFEVAGGVWEADIEVEGCWGLRRASCRTEDAP